MKMTELDFNGAQPPIDGYAPGGFRVQGRFFEGALILSSEGIASWSGDLAAEDSARLKSISEIADILLLGTGAEMRPPPAAFRQALERAGVGLEFMATPTACRTYNVLLSEDRRVVAALLPV